MLPVILFHAGFEAFSGGFVGVDVFFVISGYLITTIIIEDINNGRFSFRRFYYRRIRRVIPVLFFVMIACIPAAWCLMPPDQIQSFSKSLAAVSLFSSNFLFWQESGYFSEAAELKPLLHTWSLAIEEQFYILFPALMVVLWNLGRNWALGIILLIAMCSFVLSQWFFTVDVAAKFFLLPTRVWELLCGSVVALIVYRTGVRHNNFLSLLGLLLVIIAVFTFDKSLPFPGAYTLVPVFGTVLIILFADKETVTEKILSLRLFVGIGLISYSAYLWHQPIFSFARIGNTLEPSFEIMIGLCVLSLLLAYLTWRFVEVPFRFGASRKVRVACFSFILVSLLIFGSFYYFINHTGLAYNRYVSSAQNILYDKEINRQFMLNNGFDRFGCFFDQKQEAVSLINKRCHELRQDKPNIVLFGDSEAAHYSHGLEEFSSQNGRNLVVFTGASCRPHAYQGKKRCEKFLKLFDDKVLVNLKEHDTLVVSSNWFGSHNTIGDDEFERVVRDLLNKLRTAPSNIILVANTADFPIDPYMELSKRESLKGDQYVVARDYRQSDDLLGKVSEELGVQVFYPADYLCRDDNSIECLFMQDSNYLFFDTGHLSYYGSKVLVRKMGSLLLSGSEPQ